MKVEGQYPCTERLLVSFLLPPSAPDLLLSVTKMGCLEPEMSEEEMLEQTQHPSCERRAPRAQQGS